MDTIENRTFDELRIGDSASLTRTLAQKDIELFAVMSGDVNPAHLDEEYAKGDMFHKVIAHGMWSGALVSTVLGTMLPGPGTIYLGQSLRFLRPVALGDTVTVKVTITELDPANHHVKLDCEVVNQDRMPVVKGVAEIVAPTEKVSRPRTELPKVVLRERGRRYRALIGAASSQPPLSTAVVHAVDAVSLAGAVEAARAGLIAPVFVGPEARIRKAADSAGIDLAPYQVVPAAHSQAAAAEAVALARAGKVRALMKGALHTDELMHAVVDKACGLQAGRRISHVYAIDVPSYPRPLFVTDAAVNIYPTLEDKRDIIQNAIDLAHALGIGTPHVAILSALETIYPKIRSTIEAAALCKMADRGQITGAILDGPMAFDLAVSADAARTKGLVSPVAGKADILVVPDLEAGNMLAKQLEYLADAEVAGIVLGARVPVILTSRADGSLARMASCALAVMLAGGQLGDAGSPSLKGEQG
ncbi:bifunctional enoyl-CoA hydratase/phosphate acetyltransferase [Massilia sp. 9096]|uniref:bifunctional enoyl-CoA hydratase/phosphate acetyltransferase n=1 Tax=Massilia sp. 9096 TaxID=1500894 RepID=UPI000565C2D7|nr:bifunctional enoyl-CoA hydratase/phosphate acetyltransferase [Massilia sp. 9096]